MTRDEITAIASGRQLDRLVATLVFGWTVCDGDDDPESLSPARCSRYNTPHETVLRFSSDVGDAWRVVEHCRSEGRGIEIARYTWDTRWHVSFSLTAAQSEAEPDRAPAAGAQRFRPGANGETFPLAVCRAALLTRLP